MSTGTKNIHEKRGKNRSKRMGKYDGGFTPTEQRKKDQLMRQFMRTGEGEGGVSEAFRNAPVWCISCNNYLKQTGSEYCHRCTP